MGKLKGNSGDSSSRKHAICSSVTKFAFMTWKTREKTRLETTLFRRRFQLRNLMYLQSIHCTIFMLFNALRYIFPIILFYFSTQMFFPNRFFMTNRLKKKKNLRKKVQVILGHQHPIRDLEKSAKKYRENLKSQSKRLAQE